MAADRSLPADGARRCRYGDAVVVGGTDPSAHPALMEKRQEPCLGIRDGYAEYAFGPDSFRIVLFGVRNGSALDELDTHRGRLFGAGNACPAHFSGKATI